MTTGQLCAIRGAVLIIGTAWKCPPALITQARRSALDAIADGVTPSEAIHRALDVLSGRPRLH